MAVNGDDSMNKSVSLITRQEGFDYEFVPPLDPKYECAICLLGLRAPMQTPCGHRFCRNCILCCSNGSMVRCPVDNTLMSERDLFPDSCAEREILQLKVKCPNQSLGCTQKLDLMYIDHHTHACVFQPVMCPNDCSATVLRKEYEDHVKNKCVLRSTNCTQCGEPYAFNQEHLHMLKCPRILVPCEMCDTMMPRGDVPSHTRNVCPRVIVNCLFAEHGCHHKMTRADLDQHMEQATQQHLILLSSAHKKINAFVSDLSRTVGHIQSPSGNFSRQPSLRSQISSTSPIPENHASPFQADRTFEKNFGVTGAAGEEQGPLKTSSPSEQCEFSQEIGRLTLQLDNTSVANESKVGRSRSADFILRDLSDKSVGLDQKLLEYNIKLSNLERRVEEVSVHVEDMSATLDGKYCNGCYIWKIQEFSEMCAEMQKSPSKTHHSPPFYTSPFGYKFCLRTNVTWKENRVYLTLFVHMMQSENDDFLKWPFQGYIELTILDVGESESKKHITERMTTRPGLQAFRRTHSFRNQKGFGYTEFVLLERIMNPTESAYVKHDTLFIRAVVTPFPDVVTVSNSYQ
ncbi:TNF receptor-associated factor 6-like [Oratosquilla oratoria]|uniref:TNF receptor-associated factor 6-like n=1 Tax=Oratosquilla oratoria TaxID=337810 RepID=UPI003F774FD2